MFGADTALVFEAMQLAAVTAGITGAAVYAAMRVRRRKASDSGTVATCTKSSLEERVEVLERIATDHSIGLADEIEALREDGLHNTPSKQLEGQTQ